MKETIQLAFFVLGGIAAVVIMGHTDNLGIWPVYIYTFLILLFFFDNGCVLKKVKQFFLKNVFGIR